MAKHYAYRVDHDVGFAPHVWRGVATVCGCKVSTVERWATAGSWVVGMGGNGTGQANRLIYAMRVTGIPKYAEFCRAHPANAAYLAPFAIEPDAPVLVSRGEFYYFGDRALTLPAELANIIHRTQGCKRLSDVQVSALRSFLSNLRFGKYGDPNTRLTDAAGRCT